jgi:hypothetical protein
MAMKPVIDDLVATRAKNVGGKVRPIAPAVFHRLGGAFAQQPGSNHDSIGPIFLHARKAASNDMGVPNQNSQA